MITPTLPIIALILYFFPSLLAIGKRHSNWICAVNLLLGWTIIGWIGVLAWALQSPKQHFSCLCPICGKVRMWS